MYADAAHLWRGAGFNANLHQNTAGVGAWPGLGATLEGAARGGAAGAGELERPAVEAEADKNLLGLDVVPPQELRSELDFCQIRVCLGDGADRIVGVLGAVEVVTHQVGLVGVLKKLGYVEPAQVLVG